MAFTMALDNSTVIVWIFILISFVSIVMGSWTIYLINSNFKKDEEGALENLKFVKSSLIGFIGANILFDVIKLSINLSTGKVLSYSLFNYLNAAATVSVPISVVGVLFSLTLLKRDTQGILGNKKMDMALLGIEFIAAIVLLIFFSGTNASARSLQYFNLLSILIVNIFVYQVIKQDYSEQRIKKFGYEFLLLSIMLDIYLVIFYLSNLSQEIANSIINYSPLLFLFANLVIGNSTAAMQNILYSDQRTNKSQSILLMDSNLQNILSGIPEKTSCTVISRKNPSEIKEGLIKKNSEDKVKKFIWLSEAKMEYAISPANLEKLMYEVVTFMEQINKDPTIVIDNIEYIYSFNGFKNTLRFVQDIKDNCQARNINFLCNIASASMTQNEICAFIREFDAFEPPNKNIFTRRTFKPGENNEI